MVSTKAPTEGRALSKTIAFRCFQIHHAESTITEEVPLRNARGVLLRTNAHQAANSSSATGGLAVDRIQDSTSCQIVREKEQPVRMCPIDSATWSHNGQAAGCGRPRLANLSPVQQRSKHAS